MSFWNQCRLDRFFWFFHRCYNRNEATTIIAATIEMIATLLNSGTAGVEVDEVEPVGVAVEGVPEETTV
jgi:hypothetical protein